MVENRKRVLSFKFLVLSCGVGLTARPDFIFFRHGFTLFNFRHGLARDLHGLILDADCADFRRFLISHTGHRAFVLRQTEQEENERLFEGFSVYSQFSGISMELI